jgi:membrane protease YdiL (CAAX protease family)
MVNLSTARKLSLLARVAFQQAQQTRTWGAVLRASRITATHVGRVLHQLWLEVTGFVFLVLAAIGSLALYREYAQYQGGKTNPGRIVAAICFTLMFAWFGVSSFWKTRKRNKSLSAKDPELHERLR